MVVIQTLRTAREVEEYCDALQRGLLQAIADGKAAEVKHSEVWDDPARGLESFKEMVVIFRVI